ncbi:MAG: Mur ligase family protein [Spirochaetota bacterium]
MDARSLAQLQRQFPHLIIRGDLHQRFTHITNRYQDCREGSLYVALPGNHVDGTHFIKLAADQGASAVLHEGTLTEESEVPTISTDDARRDMSNISAWFYQTGSLSPVVIGVTGTDGKTTTCFFIYQLLQAAGIKTALLSTVYTDEGTGLCEQSARLTTPEAPGIHAFLHTAAKHGAEYAVIEASSHALSMKTKRLADIQFDAAVLTTLTSEHIDFHGSRSQYIADKRRLFLQLRHSHSPALLPKDLDFELPGTLEAVFRYSSSAFGCYVNENQITYASRFDQEVIQHDLAAACAVLISLNLPFPSHLDFLQLPKGRFHQFVRSGRRCIIDFAHTPDAFDKLFASVKKQHPRSKIISVFGAAGERDRGKRAPMGSIAAACCQLVFITSEDPRGEESFGIFQDICSELSAEEQSHIWYIEKREEAIREAVSHSKEGDVLLFLGKGHEKSIEANGVSYPWDEFEAVESAFREVFLL